MKLFRSDGALDLDVADALTELGNVSVGMATTALGNMLGIRVSIEMPRVLPAELTAMADIAESPDSVKVGILMNMRGRNEAGGTLSGMVLFVVEPEFIIEAVRNMTDVSYDSMSLIDDEEGLSAVQELANIMAAACTKAIASYTKLRIYLSPVLVGVDMVGALVAYPLAQLSLDRVSAISIDTRFALVGKDRNQFMEAGHIIILPDEPSVKVLMKSMGV